MNKNGLEVVRFLVENANSQDVTEAIRAVASGKYYAPETSLLKRAQPGDLLCYTTIRKIAEQMNLKTSCARSQVKKLKDAGIIESEQLWKTIGSDDTFDLISYDEGRRRIYTEEFSSPGGNLYRILRNPASDELYYVNLPEQLWLAFPPHEKTILAQRARFYGRKSFQVGR